MSSVRGEEEVPGLDVAVQDAALVRLRQRLACLECDPRGDVRRQLLDAGQDGAEVFPLQEFHDDEWQAAVRVDACLQHLRDVARVEGCDGARLPLEAGHLGLVGGQLFGEDLDRHPRAVEAERLVDNTHPALPDHAGDRVFPGDGERKLGHGPGKGDDARRDVGGSRFYVLSTV